MRHPEGTLRVDSDFRNIQGQRVLDRVRELVALLREERLLDRCVGFSWDSDGICSVQLAQENEHAEDQKGQGKRQGLLAQPLPGAPTSEDPKPEPPPNKHQLVEDLRNLLPGAQFPRSLTGGDS